MRGTPSFTDEPCPRCLDLAKRHKLRVETVQRLPAGAWAPLSRQTKQSQCFDCSSAETLMGLKIVPDFEMARVVIGNERQEQYRLPGVLMGLAQDGLVRLSAPGDLEKQHAWLKSHNWFDVDETLTP